MTAMRAAPERSEHEQLLARVARPNRFALLMELYEQNFVRLRQLFPSVRQLTGACVSTLAGSPPLWIQAVAQERHTSVLLLTHVFDSAEHDPLEPAAYVRVYHDAQQAEVTHFRVGAGLRALFAADASLARIHQRRLRYNSFFAKWLDFLATCGHAVHSFEAARLLLGTATNRSAAVLTDGSTADIICGSRVGL